MAWTFFELRCLNVLTFYFEALNLKFEILHLKLIQYKITGRFDNSHFQAMMSLFLSEAKLGMHPS